jgi:hypothetical protein
MSVRFNPSSVRPVRAVQAWQILIGHGMNRQTITYAQLGELMFHRRSHGVLDEILGCILQYCQQNDLPLLNCLVVARETGRPGYMPPGVDPDAERERVYECDWYNILAPSSSNLADAWQAAA